MGVVNTIHNKNEGFYDCYPCWFGCCSPGYHLPWIPCGSCCPSICSCCSCYPFYWPPCGSCCCSLCPPCCSLCSSSCCSLQPCSCLCPCPSNCSPCPCLCSRCSHCPPCSCPCLQGDTRALHIHLCCCR